MKVQDKIRNLREMHQFTQEEMAHKLNLSKNGYANIERGETKATLERLEQIASIFGIDVMDLVNYGEKNTNFYDNSTNNGLITGINIIGHSENLDKLLTLEIAKLQLIISHKDELLMQKEQENQLLKKLIDKMEKNSDS